MNLGAPEIIIVLLVALIVLGPKRLPDAARQLGKAVSEFKEATSGINAEVRDALHTVPGDKVVDDEAGDKTIDITDEATKTQHPSE